MVVRLERGWGGRDTYLLDKKNGETHPVTKLKINSIASISLDIYKYNLVIVDYFSLMIFYFFLKCVSVPAAATDRRRGIAVVGVDVSAPRRWTMTSSIYGPLWGNKVKQNVTKEIRDKL